MKSERSRLKKNLDDITSKIVRKRDKFCVICGLPVQFNGTGDPVSNDCGHFISRKIELLRWDLRNCNCQCRSCNWKHNDNSLPYHNFMLEHYGQEVIDELQELYIKNRTTKTTVPELRELLREMKEIYKEMR